MKIAIDTNVPIAANGRDTHASLACQLRCIDFLENIVSGKHKGVVLLDDSDQIINEYSRYFYYHGQPGVGDVFFKFLHDNMYNTERVERVIINQIQDQSRGYEELPQNELDPSDRKFLATAVVSGADIVNALDTDWHEQANLLDSVNITVCQICPEHGCL